MLTRDDLLKRVKENGGEWEPEPGMIFKTDKSDETVHVRDEKTKMSAFFMKHMGEDMAKFYISSSFNLEDLGNAIEFSRKLAKHVGFNLEVKGAETIEVVKEIKNEKEEARLGGMVQAYEKILIGREITAKQ
jgi:hypothetical protein